MSKTYYKILVDGRSCNGGRLTWSLPKHGKPGDWHQVEGQLVRCQNGLHLTSEPTYRRIAKSLCYEAEFDGETLGPFLDELVVRRCRLLRRVAWSEFKCEDQLDPEPGVRSQAMTLLHHVWASTQGRSWRVINESMQVALRLAIESGMSFNIDDFAEIAKEFNASYWLHVEGAYKRACDGPHGPNPSAYQAIEKRLGRTPFLVHESARSVAYDPESPPAPKIRLHVGARFDWHIRLKTKVRVEVTSFKDEDKTLIACSYKPSESGYERKIDKRFRITHDDIAEYHAAIREFRKKSAGASADIATQ